MTPLDLYHHRLRETSSITVLHGCAGLVMATMAMVSVATERPYWFTLLCATFALSAAYYTSENFRRLRGLIEKPPHL